MHHHNTSHPTIRVEGHGRIVTSAEIALVSLMLESKHPKYASMVKHLNRKLEGLRDALVKADVEPKLLRSDIYQVNSIVRRLKAGTEVRSYHGVHALEFTMPCDTARIARIMSAATKSSTFPTLSIKFKVVDEEALQRRALENATSNALQRAQVIAAATGHSLGKLAGIDYTSNGHGISPRTIEFESFADGEICPEIEPQDIIAEDQITASWELAQSTGTTVS